MDLPFPTISCVDISSTFKTILLIIYHGGGEVVDAYAYNGGYVDHILFQIHVKEASLARLLLYCANLRSTHYNYCTSF